MGYKLEKGQDALLGKWAKRHLESQGKIPHGRYEIHTYIDSEQTREVVKAFFA